MENTEKNTSEETSILKGSDISSSMLKDKGYYWVQSFKDDNEWEVARFKESDRRFKFTNGSQQALRNIYLVDTNSLDIEMPEKYKLVIEAYKKSCGLFADAAEKHLELKDQVIQLKNSNTELLEALSGMKKLNLHQYEDGTVGNDCYKQMLNAIEKANKYVL